MIVLLIWKQDNVLSDTVGFTYYSNIKKKTTKNKLLISDGFMRVICSTCSHIHSLLITSVNNERTQIRRLNDRFVERDPEVSSDGDVLLTGHRCHLRLCAVGLEVWWDFLTAPT